MALWLAACTTLGGPRTIVLSEADLSRLIERRAPLERRLLEVFDIRIDKPVVRTLPDSGRLATEFDLSATNRLSGRAPSTFHVAFDYALRYSAADAAIQMTQVRVRQLGTGTDDALPRQPERFAALVAEYMLEGLAIYQLRPEDLKTAQGLGLKPDSIAVTSRGVEITLLPAGR